MSPAITATMTRCKERSAASEITAPTTNAPATVAASPNVDTAPDVPRGTGASVMIDQGSRRERTPSSGAQVSALAVGIAPVPFGELALGQRLLGSPHPAQQRRSEEEGAERRKRERSTGEEERADQGGGQRARQRQRALAERHHGDPDG